MKLNLHTIQLKSVSLKTVAMGSIAALALLAAPLSLVQSAHAEGGRRADSLEQLNLSEAQTSQIEAIRAEARSQRESVLTPEQQTALENSELRGRRALRQLDLSDTQRSQLRDIHQAAREQVSNVLTDEQRSQLEAIREERREGRHERRSQRR